MKVLIGFLLFNLLFSFKVFSSYIEEKHLGEFDFELYQGPLSPLGFPDSQNREQVILDNQFRNKYIEPLLASHFYELNSFWDNTFLNEWECPDKLLDSKYEYIRYLFRLVTFSYLMEDFKSSYTLMKKIGLENSNCDLNYKKLFNKCSPQTQDMATYLGRLEKFFNNQASKFLVRRLKKEEISDFFNYLKTSNEIDLMKDRFQQWLKESSKTAVNKITVNEYLEYRCPIVKEKLQLICNEADSLFGLSSVFEAKFLVEQSSAIVPINKDSKAQECLNRFVTTLAPHEIDDPYYVTLFPTVLGVRSEKKLSYLEGEFYIPGALKEFDEKGLSDFLFHEIKEDTIDFNNKIVNLDVVEVKAERRKKSAMPILKRREKKEAKKTAPKRNVRTKSAVKLALDRLQKFKLKESSVNMNFFKRDFIFTPKRRSIFDKNLKGFHTVVALKEMKIYDKLGTLDRPLSLIYLKYLIDLGNHKGLYNILNVLGDKFYIENDIDKSKTPLLVNIRNNEKTAFKWQLYLLSEN